MTRNSSSLFLLSLATFIVCASSFPTFWPGQVNTDAVCDSHPTGPNKGHGKVTKDKTPKLKLMKGKKVVKGYCPGESYTVEVTFTEARKGLLTSSGGSFTPETIAMDLENCATRKNFLGDDKQAALTTYTAEWKAPCKGKRVTLKITSASSPVSGFMYTTKRFRKAKKCKKTKAC